ncbi:MAG: restriction endonuclease [Flavobacteriales bacterium]|nr:restriction endonuclease [Flavobacteriales bacterium]
MNAVPHRYDLMAATLKALSALGGSGTIEEIREKVIELMAIPDEVANLPYTTKRGNVDGRTAVEYSLAWARTYLGQMGYLENSSRGIWSLTATGSDPSAMTDLRSKKERKTSSESPSQADWKQELLLICQSMAPTAFERLVQRILRDTGFVQVEVTGRSGDGGIDGKGIAKINGILSFHVVFQCKRYTGAVGSSEIRNFRGAMQGRADKGLFITTGYFTRDAIREAVRDGASAIDLVDGDKLAEKLKTLGLGVKVEYIESVSPDPEWFKTL